MVINSELINGDKGQAKEIIQVNVKLEKRLVKFRKRVIKLEGMAVGQRTSCQSEGSGKCDRGQTTLWRKLCLILKLPDF